jgi:hypothetical protein
MWRNLNGKLRLEVCGFGDQWQKYLQGQVEPDLPHEGVK